MFYYSADYWKILFSTLMLQFVDGGGDGHVFSQCGHRGGDSGDLRGGQSVVVNSE